jgi:hypothetical protein
MKEFKPSPTFVSEVMRAVRTYEESRDSAFARSRVFLSSPFGRYAVSAAGVLAGIINLVRIYMAVFSPVVCR